MQFCVLFERKILESDVTYFVLLSSSLIFFHFPRTKLQSGITTVAGTKEDCNMYWARFPREHATSVTSASAGLGHKWSEILNPIQTEQQRERPQVIKIDSHLIG